MHTAVCSPHFSRQQNSRSLSNMCAPTPLLTHKHCLSAPRRREVLKRAKMTTSRILLVEDAPANIQVVSSILKEQGCQINVATNGQQALDVLGRVRPDLILLDVMMPGMDGFETCKRIKDSTAWREIPIIFVTARNETVDIVRGFEAGAVDYVAKPFNAPELIARVRTHLALDHLHRENQRLLLNVLPAPIAEKLKKQQGIIAERFEDVSV